MSDDTSTRAKEIFQDAIELPVTERERFVAERCAGDAGLLAHVRRLLRAHASAGEFLAAPTGPTARATGLRHGADPPEEPGTRIGPYKLLELIGEGGFGRVYMAEQEQPIRRRVALKIIRFGMDTKAVIARFEAERQALALMDHPNIAKVLDAGATPAGRPFFVMELVRGLPITEYCDANRATTSERLELFVDVCRALHHAHEKGIVHRDIKPSNVLVTLHDGTPVVKVIDFGIAKAMNQPLTEKTLFTAWGEFVGTPAYMSPEQAALGGLEINRRCDVYALGVLLYELLTGTTPLEEESLRTRAFLEIMRIIREEDPPTPSTRLTMLGERLLEVASRRRAEPGKLARLLRGDLDWIVMKALEKDRRRRYESTADLADDVVRYFRHEPVTARRASTAYRIARFARRRRAPIGAAALVLVAAVLGGSLARIGGDVPGSAAPSLRLIVDLREDSLTQVPLYDDRVELRYARARNGFEVRNSRNGRVRQFIPVAPEFLSPIWGTNEVSPDHRQIAIPRRIASGADSGRIEMRVFSAGGSPEGRRIAVWENMWQVRPFAWSHDLRRLWVFAYGDRPHIAAVDVADGAEKIVKRLTWHNTTQTPSLSPDGQYIVYHDADGPEKPADIFILAADGTREFRLEHPSDDSNPLFTPDGTGIIFQSYREGRDLWYQQVKDGRPVGEPRAVWRDTGPYGMALQFSAAGSLYYYFATNGWALHSIAVDLGAGRVGRPVAIAARSDEVNDAPTYSPDGRLLAHVRGDGHRVVIRDLERGTERELPTGTRLTMPALDFCPDGTTLLLSGYQGSRGQVVYRIDITRGGAERLELEPQIYTPALCVGTDEIVYVREASHIVRRSLSTAAETGLWRAHAPRVSLYRSPDRSRIAVLTQPLSGAVQRTGSAELVLVPTVGGAASALAGSWLGVHGVMWLPSNDGLLVARSVDDESPSDEAAPEIALMRVDLSGAATEIGRTRLPAHRDGIWGSYHWTIHPDGSPVSFSRHTGWTAQVWAIDNLLAYIRTGASAPARVRR